MTRGRLTRSIAMAMIALPTAAGLGLAAPAATAAGLTAVAASPMSDARSAANEALSLRRDVAALLQRYVDDYRDRFTEAEVQQLLQYRREADQRLAGVVVTTGRTRSIASSGGGAARVASAASKAYVSWTRAKSAAEQTWASARQVMEPRLSLFEKLAASSDYNAMMDRFDALGDRIARLKDRS